MSNVYYNPQDFGLEQVAEFEYSSGCYEFDTRVVWKHTRSGKLYMARDSGCSCPTPFEGFNSIESLEDFSESVLVEEIRASGQCDASDIMLVRRLAGEVKP